MRSVEKDCFDCGEAYLAFPQGRAPRCPACSHKRQRFQINISQTVAKAVKAGLLAKQPCEVCGAEKSEAHHDDYTKPLSVRWLCRTHHRLHHEREYRAADDERFMRELSDGPQAA